MERGHLPDLGNAPLKFFVAATKKCVLPFVGKTTERHACLGPKPGLTLRDTPTALHKAKWTEPGAPLKRERR